MTLNYVFCELKTQIDFSLKGILNRAYESGQRGSCLSHTPGYSKSAEGLFFITWLNPAKFNMLRQASQKSETTLVNQLSILVYKCGLRFFARESEHCAKTDLKSYYSTLLKTVKRLSFCQQQGSRRDRLKATVLI